MNAGRRPSIPIVGLIGPTNLPKIASASGIAEEHYRDAAYKAGAEIARAGAALAVVPDRGVAVLGMQGYRDAGGPWIIGLAPSGGPSDAVASPNCSANASGCDEIVGGFTWHHQHALICELCSLMVCVGLSCGTLAEIAWTKWVKGPRILVMRDTITALPREILAETDVVSIESFGDLAEQMAAALLQDAPDL
jgi:predicted Rossmann-fold nucleotide-binding protein